MLKSLLGLQFRRNHNNQTNGKKQRQSKRTLSVPNFLRLGAVILLYADIATAADNCPCHYYTKSYEADPSADNPPRLRQRESEDLENSDNDDDNVAAWSEPGYNDDNQNVRKAGAKLEFHKDRNDSTKCPTADDANIEYIAYWNYQNNKEGDGSYKVYTVESVFENAD